MLDLIWHAEFKDESILNQFEDFDQKQENSFKIVLEKKEDLKKFSLTNIHTNLSYVVNLETGIFGIISPLLNNELLELDEDMKNDTTYKYRLIYFRRVSRTFGADFKEIGDAHIIYFLGYQYTDEQNKNHKRLMKIHSDGRFIIN